MYRHLLLAIITLLPLCKVSAKWLEYTDQDGVVMSFETTNDKDCEFKGLKGYLVPENLMIPGTVKSDGVEYTVTSIGAKALEKQYSIKYVDIPNTVKFMRERAFANTGLNSLVIPNSVSLIESCAFASVPMRSLTLGRDAVIVDKDAFDQCLHLNKVFVLSRDPLSRPFESLQRWVARRYVANPTYIYLAFKDDNFLGLEGKYTHVRVLDMLNMAFEVDGIKYVPTSLEDRTCIAVDGVYRSDCTTVSVNPTVKYRNVDMTVTEICPSLFTEDPYLTKVNYNVNHDMPPYLLYLCENLSTVNINSACDTIGKMAMSGLPLLTSIRLPSQLRKIQDYALSGNDNLTEVAIPSTLTNIGEGAFSRCKSLKSIRLPELVDTIYGYAFSDCESLEDINFPDSLKCIESGAFANTGFKSISFPNTITYIGQYVISGKQLTKLIVEDGPEPLFFFTSFSAILR